MVRATLLLPVLLQQPRSEVWAVGGPHGGYYYCSLPCETTLQEWLLLCPVAAVAAGLEQPLLLPLCCLLLEWHCCQQLLLKVLHAEAHHALLVLLLLVIQLSASAGPVEGGSHPQHLTEAYTSPLEQTKREG